MARYVTGQVIETYSVFGTRVIQESYLLPRVLLSVRLRCVPFRPVVANWVELYDTKRHGNRTYADL